MQLGVGLQRTGSIRKLKVEGQVLGIRWDLVVLLQGSSEIQGGCFLSSHQQP